MSTDGGRFGGAILIIRLNWPIYALGAGVIFAWPLLCSRLGDHLLVAAGWLIWVGTLWWMAASVVASHWVYDRSQLRNTKWITGILPRTPRRWLNIHSGFDQHTAALREMYPHCAGVSLDIFDGSRMTEPAIRRARRRFPAQAVLTRHSALPVREESVDAVFLLFAGHELRTCSAREELYKEIGGVLNPTGRLVIAEHVRDLSNVAAYGPGAWHFLPRAEWLRLANAGDFLVDSEITITPFVIAWSFSKRN